ncbi:MAG: hypothetical protein ACRD2X_02815, partial [Vicinamibacteraceae bacterium]
MPRPTSLIVLLIAPVLLTDGSAVELVRRSEPNPFWFFEPTVELDGEERESITQGEPLVKVLDAEDQQLAVFAGGSLVT